MGFAALLAIVTALAGGLEYGRHSVGYQRIDGNPAISLWYPSARAADVPRMTLRAYGAGLPPGLSSGIVMRYLDSPLRAILDARAASRRFPLVLVAHGNAQDAGDQAILAEYLASHGFIVAATPSPMLATPMTSIEEMAAFAERQADDLAAAIDAIERRRIASTGEIVVIGHSFGARSALLLAMREARVKGLVSLDVDAFMKADFAFLDSLGAPSLQKERAAGMRHAQFTSAGFGAAAIPELGQIMKTGPELRDTVNSMARKTLLFVQRQTGR